MLRTLLPLCVLTTAVLGCDPAPSDNACDAVVHDGFRKLGANGVSLNGTSFNGVGLNGISVNGVSVNGVSLNGRLNGVSLNGVSLNGSQLGGVDVADGTVADVQLEGTALVGTTASGTRIAGSDWVGATLEASVGSERIELEIAAVERDADDPSIEWVALEVDGQPLCGEGGRGLFMAGVWDDAGARHDAFEGDRDVRYTFACDTGVLAKCITWGYAPYAAGTDAHQACTRLARADYCGDGIAHTADGTLIDVFDTLGVQRSDASVDLEFEAGWGPDGAVCASRPRYDEIGSDGDDIAATCWDRLPACETADEAASAGAILMSRSARQTLCYE